MRISIQRKLEVIEYSKMKGNNEAAEYKKVIIKTIRKWRKKEEELKIIKNTEKNDLTLR